MGLWFLRNKKLIDPRLKAFSVLVNGKNAWVICEGKKEKWGFYTTRIVLCVDDETAKSEAVALVRKELEPQLLNDELDKPEYFVEGIEEIPMPKRYKPGKGFTFYPDGVE